MDNTEVETFGKAVKRLESKYKVTLNKYGESTIFIKESDCFVMDFFNGLEELFISFGYDYNWSHCRVSKTRVVSTIVGLNTRGSKTLSPVITLTYLMRVK